MEQSTTLFSNYLGLQNPVVEYKLPIGNGHWPTLARRLVQTMLVGTGKKHTTYSVKLLEQFLMDPQCLGMFFGIS